MLQNLAWSAVAISYVSATLRIIGEIVAGLTIWFALKASAIATAQEELEKLSNNLKNVSTQDTSHLLRQDRNTMNLNQFFNHNEPRRRALLAEHNSQGAGNAAHQMALS